MIHNAENNSNLFEHMLILANLWRNNAYLIISIKHQMWKKNSLNVTLGIENVFMKFLCY